MNITFRNMKEEDIPQIVAIEEASFATPWTAEAFERELKMNEYAHYVVLETEEGILGYCGLWVVLDESHITNIAVLPQYRGQRLGEVLLQEVMNKARALGANTMTLEVRVSNEVAKKLYRKFGFQNGGIRKRYYTDNYEDGLVMWVNL
ncbi:ribosomal-protein-alanine N-acetyltransferase [Bacillus sp. AFS018417]|uniref:ribosomal protein S18-alanine N-acetyltransferase n=1 Tax=unclassified Bacillus (in: firmicutes) TaxID=185979 RepID=UPI000BF50D0F|nr:MULTISPECIES: ribosomal protein S18-alanine N-acetyltransferase [unclassified Bacillus (in: firmicutes)]MCP1122055.1 ribosomal protein S18-alanine N-acetyltransferase [Bacillus sp. 3103sda1]PEZ05347.1 ribosomal-protein-alanine N-acetyltransferase [Bacillus sp. AFS018417]